MNTDSYEDWQRWFLGFQSIRQTDRWQRSDDWSDIFGAHLWSYTDPSLHFFSSLLHSACHQTRQQITEDVIFVAESSAEAPGQAGEQTSGGSYLLTNGILMSGLSSFNWWVLLVDGAQYHGGFLLHASLVAWITLQGAKAFGHAKVLLNRWQETSEESGTGQQMEKRSRRKPEECSAYIWQPASTLILLRLLTSTIFSVRFYRVCPKTRRWRKKQTEEKLRCFFFNGEWWLHKWYLSRQF